MDGCRRSYEAFYHDLFWIRSNVSKQCFDHCLCLPSDIRMTEKEQEHIIDIVLACFNKVDLDREMWAER